MRASLILILGLFVTGCATANKCVYFKLYDESSTLDVTLPKVGYQPFSVDGGKFTVAGRVSYFSMPVGDDVWENQRIEEHCVRNAPDYFSFTE